MLGHGGTQLLKDIVNIDTYIIKAEYTVIYITHFVFNNKVFLNQIFVIFKYYIQSLRNLSK
jgi:hypothetical protein